MKIDESLQEIKPEHTRLVVADREFAQYRETELRPILEQIRIWQKDHTNVRDLSGYRGKNFIVGCYNSRGYVPLCQTHAESFFEELRQDSREIMLGSEELSISLEKGVSEEINARWHRLGQQAVAFYDAYTYSKFADDFKGIFLFAGSDYIDYRVDINFKRPWKDLQNEIRRLGNWDYAASSYNSKNIPEKRKNELKELGLVNPEILLDGGFFVSGWESNHWEYVLICNKSTRLVNWEIDGYCLSEESLPKGVKFSSYDIVFLQSGFTPEKCAPELALKLLRQGGVIVASSSSYERGISTERIIQTRQVKPLLTNKEMEYNLFEKV